MDASTLRRARPPAFPPRRLGRSPESADRGWAEQHRCLNRPSSHDRAPTRPRLAQRCHLKGRGRACGDLGSPSCRVRLVPRVTLLSLLSPRWGRISPPAPAPSPLRLPLTSSSRESPRVESLHYVLRHLATGPSFPTLLKSPGDRFRVGLSHPPRPCPCPCPCSVV